MSHAEVLWSNFISQTLLALALTHTLERAAFPQLGRLLAWEWAVVVGTSVSINWLANLLQQASFGGVVAPPSQVVVGWLVWAVCAARHPAVAVVEEWVGSAHTPRLAPPPPNPNALYHCNAGHDQGVGGTTGGQLPGETGSPAWCYSLPPPANFSVDLYAGSLPSSLLRALQTLVQQREMRQ